MDESVKRIEHDGQVWWEYHGKRYPDICRRGNACAAIAEKADVYCEGNGLDIGAGAYPLGGALPVRDNVNFVYHGGRQTRRASPYLRGINAYNLDCFADNFFDYIFSSHCLEHLDKPQAALNLWTKKIRIGGLVFLYLPHPSMELWRMGSPWVGKNHRWIPEPKQVCEMLKTAGLTIYDATMEPDKFYSFYAVGCKNG